jgi:hypothetical protein
MRFPVSDQLLIKLDLFSPVCRKQSTLMFLGPGFQVYPIFRVRSLIVARGRQAMGKTVEASI